MKIVYFEWVDACGNSGWFNAEDCKGPMNAKIIGFLVRETKDHVTVSTGMTEDNQFMGYVTIPKGWIKKRKNVKV